MMVFKGKFFVFAVFNANPIVTAVEHLTHFFCSDSLYWR